MPSVVVICFLTALFQVCLSDSTEKPRALDEVCSQPPKTGVCRALFRMYYYNATSDVCRKFAYGGCGGNGNKFWRAEDCVAACGGTVDENDDFLPSFHGDLDDYDLGGHPCSEPHDYGSGDGSLVRFYFDGSKCSPFLYSGSGGNSNNFKSRKECENECSSIDEK